MHLYNLNLKFVLFLYWLSFCSVACVQFVQHNVIVSVTMTTMSSSLHADLAAETRIVPENAKLRNNFNDVFSRVFIDSRSTRGSCYTRPSVAARASSVKLSSLALELSYPSFMTSYVTIILRATNVQSVVQELQCTADVTEHVE